MIGDATAWQREKSDPRAPPRRTMSYLELMGREKEFLYVFRVDRVYDRTVFLLLEEASRL
jgi:hypothetical protein